METDISGLTVGIGETLGERETLTIYTMVSGWTGNVGTRRDTYTVYTVLILVADCIAAWNDTYAIDTDMIDGTVY